MKPLKLKHNQPEQKVREDIVKMLRYKGWFVKVTHGSMYQSGLPDLIACHRMYGVRFIEVKLPNMVGSHFTPAQLADFANFTANGCQVWVLTSDAETEYAKLFNKGNWYVYLGMHKDSM